MKDNRIIRPELMNEKDKEVMNKALDNFYDKYYGKGLEERLAKRYVTRDREAGNVIEKFKTLDEAREKIKKYEDQDKADGMVSPIVEEIK